MWYKNLIYIISVIGIAYAGGEFSPIAAANTWPTEKQCKKIKDPKVVIKGWCAAINRTAGNCLACHLISVFPWPEGFPEAGNIAPPLAAMRTRFPDKQKLRKQIWDATINNPNTSMPPFGKHKLLSEEEIDNIIIFLYSI